MHGYETLDRQQKGNYTCCSIIFESILYLLISLLTTNIVDRQVAIV